MRTTLIALLAAGGLAGRGLADPVLHGPPKAAAEILAAETRFSARFGEIGIARAMPEFLDAQAGLAFTGADPPVRAAHAFEAFGGDAAGAHLSWTPAEIFAAAAGDMGASWGRFTLIDPKGARRPTTGRYVTVWRKDEQGRWKALMDIGETDPAR